REAVARFTAPASDQPLVFRVTVADGAGRADDLVVVRVDSRAPQIVAQAEAGGEVRFAAELPPGATAAWEFGDGATSGEPQPRHTYARSGTYTVRLLVDGEAVQQVVEVDVRQGLERQRPVQEHAPAALAGLPLAHVLAAFAAVALVVGAAAFALARRQ
ncbi:MAG TPA: PKD domain-containing protein, partial [Candidatus Thermoplasmatota archaeon]|nr:PKD domain-containing protein [Candidatus Thermoplasmatota archaeon]